MEYDAFVKSMAEIQKSLGTSGYTKAIVDLQKSIASADMRPYASAMIEASRVARSMEETFSISLKNLGIAPWLDASKLSETAMRMAIGPLEELQKSGFLSAFPTQPQIEAIQGTIATLESRFRLPEFTEAARLIAGFQVSHVAESLAKYNVAIPDLKLAMEGMRSPWLSVLEESASVTGFAEIQGIGLAVARLGAFDESLSSVLRANLGDWREQITWRPEIFTDLAARSDFYVSLGFNPAVTAFPLQAFEESLEIAGLEPSVIPESADLVANEEERGLSRTNRAHDELQRFERSMRKFIDKVMTEACSPKWPKQRLPQEIYERWREKKQKAEQAGAMERPIIEYADFTDYEPLISRSDNWREVFAPFFRRQESLRESLQRLYPIRLDTMHGRLITQDDELFLRVEIKRLAKVILK